MSYLYGDSTPSPLEVNFVDFLRDCLDFGVEVALSTDGLRRQTQRGDLLRREARRDIDRLEKLGTGVELAVKSLSVDEGDTPTARCALAIIRSTSDLVRNEIQGVNSTVGIEEAKLEVARAGERANCVKALEALLLRHDLPDTSARLNLKARPNAPYAAQLRTATPLGIAATIELDVPSSDMFGHLIRVDRILDRLEVQAPEVGGWLHKERKMRAQRLEKLHVIELDLGAKEKLHEAANRGGRSGPGFDLLMSADAPHVRLMRVEERDGLTDPPFEVDDADARKLLGLLQKLEAPAQALVAHRKALVQATLDDRPLRDHDEPTLLVERLVQAIAPVVREIAERSPSTTELVLKRLVGGGRREEIFVAKSELREKLERLPINLRALFDPLGLGDERAGVPTSVAASARPAPETSRRGEPKGNEPTTLVMARRFGPEAPAGEPPRPTGEPAKPEVTVEQIDAGFQSINLQDDKPTSE